MRHLIFVLGPTLHLNRCSLARATGLFFFHGSFCLVKVNGSWKDAVSSSKFRPGNAQLKKMKKKHHLNR